MAANWIEIGTIDYLFKMVMGVLIFLPLYGVILTKLQKMLAEKWKVKPTHNSKFKITPIKKGYNE